MENVRFAAVALVAALFVACTNAAEPTSSDLDTMPQPGKRANDAKADTAEPAEEPLTGKPQSQEPSSPPPTPAVSPICGSGLTCSASATTGASACRQTATSTTDVFCCPIAGWRIQNGQCIPPLCGTGLTCSGAPTVGAPACRQTTTSTKDVFCCPTQGAKIVDGTCQ